MLQNKQMASYIYNAECGQVRDNNVREYICIKEGGKGERLMARVDNICTYIVKASMDG